MLRPWFSQFFPCIVLTLLAVPVSAAVVITVDGAQERQVIEGFGCTWQSEVFGTNDILTPSQRARVVDLQFNQVGLRIGQAPPLFEAPQSAGANFFDQRANVNGDATTINWAGFNSWLADQFKSAVIDLAPAGKSGGVYPGILLNTRWSSPWINSLPSTQAILDECAEQAVANITWWKNAYGVEPRWAHLTNEPFSGNGELSGLGQNLAPALVKACWARLRAAGFSTVKFIVSSDETEEISLNVAQTVLGDADSRQYVAAIGYHPYPYGSEYCDGARILATTGTGNPVASRVQVRQQLRDLAAANGVQCWMTEVSNSGFAATDFRLLRARAIHIHDEFLYARASAFFGMNSSWSRTAQALHFGGDGGGFAGGSESDSISLADQSSDQVFISGTGYAIGHYARWLTAGAARAIDASSTDALVQVSAFHDTAAQRFVAVLINNADTPHEVVVSASGLSLSGQITGERSTASAYWAALPRSL